MIFITVGTEMPFDRLIQAVDRWAGARARRDIFAQIGQAGWKPENFTSAEFLDPVEFKSLLRRASLVVGHAGMGTILSALNAAKPVLVMPRRASLGEQRNEHQLATARALEQRDGVAVAYTEEELCRRLDDAGHLSAGPRLGAFAQEPLQAAIRSFIGAVPTK